MAGIRFWSCLPPPQNVFRVCFHHRNDDAGVLRFGYFESRGAGSFDGGLLCSSLRSSMPRSRFCRLSSMSIISFFFFSIFPLLPPYKPNLSIPARRSSSVPNKFIAHGGGRFFTTYLVSPCISCTLPCSLFLPSVSSSSMSTLTA